jgi:uncharacterized protein YqjF (DUF2071 family)
MRSLLTVTGRDVLFAHWPVDADALGPHVPDTLVVDTYDGSAWVSALALEVVAVRPGSPGRAGSLGKQALPSLPTGPFPQLVFRTYVRHEEETGIYFLSVDSGLRSAATVGRRAFGLPFHAARVRSTRREDGTITFGSRRRRRGPGADAGSAPAVFELRYRSTGDPFEADPGSFEAFGIERFRYFLPLSEDRRPGAVDGDGDRVVGAPMRVGTVDREPWTLRGADATVRRNTLFEAAGLPEPTEGPTATYSPGFEIRVGPLERRADG